MSDFLSVRVESPKSSIPVLLNKVIKKSDLKWWERTYLAWIMKRAVIDGNG
jgi:hypothetical protein